MLIVMDKDATPEMIQDQKAKADLIRRLLEAPTAEERTALAGENEEMVDEEFFRLLQVNLGQAEAMGQQELAQRILDVRTLLYEQTPVGRQRAARGETLQALQDEPTRDRLLELLVASEDPDTRAMLIAMGQPLLDYFFFQAITQRIEGASDRAERERLEALRYAEMLRPGGTLLVNDYRIAPVTVSSGDSSYPSDAEEEQSYATAIPRRYYVPAMEMARELGQVRVNNVVMLGVLP